KSAGGELDSRTDRKNGTGAMLIGKARDRGPGLMGRVAWGQTGAIRLVLLRWPPPGERTDRALRVRIINEGEQTFTVQPGDTWTVRTEQGTAIPATRPGGGAEESLAVGPKGTIEVDLDLADTPRHRIAALEYRSGVIGGIVEIRTPWFDPQPRLVVPPEYPARALEAGGVGQVTLAAAVGADGRVEQVYVHSPPEDQDHYGLREAAMNAVMGWIFDPAMENREPQRGLREVTLTFAGVPVS